LLHVSELPEDPLRFVWKDWDVCVCVCVYQLKPARLFPPKLRLTIFA
jgi:hypothetical protein